MKRERKGRYSPTLLNEGEMPKPNRLKALCRLVDKLHKELLAAKEPTRIISLKDPRTVVSYHKTLEKLVATQLQIEDMINFLEKALYGDNN
jgi:hypothetical protein